MFYPTATPAQPVCTHAPGYVTLTPPCYTCLWCHIWYYVLEQVTTLTVCVEKEEKAVPICNSLQSFPGCCMGIIWGRQWERSECWEHWKTTGLTWLPSDKPIPLGICLCGAWWAAQPRPACARGCLGALWLGLCGPESKLMSSIKDRLYWTSLKSPSPVFHLFFSPLTETEPNSSLSGFLPCTAHSTTGSPNQLCPAHFFLDFVHIPQMSASWS